MPVIKVSVKWQKNKYDVDLETDEPPLLFKTQLYALTGVAPERQKVMTKGGILKDDDDWDKIKVQEGQTWMMMGTVGADAVVAPPQQRTKFVEDMAENEVPTGFPPGLRNLGNTCYLNATLQCLGKVPELKHALEKYNAQVGLDPSNNITLQLKQVYGALDKSQTAIAPILFLDELRKAFPQFAERGEGGMFMQQDSSECWQQIVKCLDNKLPGVSTEGAAGSKSFVKQYFTYELASKLKCTDPGAASEPETTERSESQVLQCNISLQTNFMAQGIKEGLEGTLEKHSPSLDRNAVYNKISKLDRLPAYLTVEFVRFFWKAKEQVKAKVLRNVKFPVNFDAYEFCSEELKAKLLPMRKMFQEEAQKEVDKRAKLADLKSKDGAGAMDVDTKKATHPYDFADDPGSNNSGYYELGAVLTHQGRSADSGHYVAWVRDKGDKWLKFDDDKVTGVTEEEVLKLSGGGDWHMAYLLLYVPKVLVTED
eukprot:comp22860_c0_seq1/m.36067 comp22860_c0_seq1/g.36067  ORF comp22860_c0_seq1/g.36067 comp22860_c0_seq1/m.36067 type:complete len:482 (-) comp22860_c0_seq1:741-2186(-)